jgi:hypothetical protein
MLYLLDYYMDSENKKGAFQIRPLLRHCRANQEDVKDAPMLLGAVLDTFPGFEKWQFSEGTQSKLRDIYYCYIFMF